MLSRRGRASTSLLETLEKVDTLYKIIITAGTYRAESIRVAGAAKVIENTQRDVNIALINELALIFRRSREIDDPETNPCWQESYPDLRCYI